MLFTFFLTVPLLTTGAVAIMAPPLVGMATLLALAWAGVGWLATHRPGASR